MLFGLPLPSGRAAGEAGDLVLMGCIEPDSPPQYQCAAGHQWRGADESKWQEAVLVALRLHGYEDQGMTETEAEALASVVREDLPTGVSVSRTPGAYVVELEHASGQWTLYDEDDWVSWRPEILRG